MSKFTGTLTSPHPTQTPKFTKHTWREQVHRDVNIPPTPNPKKKGKGVSWPVTWGWRWVLGWLEGLHYDSDYDAFCAILHYTVMQQRSGHHPQNLPLLRWYLETCIFLFFKTITKNKWVVFQNTWWLIITGGYTIKYIGDYHNPLWEILLINQYKGTT